MYVYRVFHKKVWLRIYPKFGAAQWSVNKQASGWDVDVEVLSVEQMPKGVEKMSMEQLGDPELSVCPRLSVETQNVEQLSDPPITGLNMKLSVELNSFATEENTPSVEL